MRHNGKKRLEMDSNGDVGKRIAKWKIGDRNATVANKTIVLLF